MTPEDQSRSEFEAHILSMSLTSLDRFSEGLGGHYRLFSVHQAWLAWQASRRTYRASVLEAAQAVITARDNFGWSADVDAEIERLRSALATQTPPCRGTACGTTTGEHSAECVAEHARGLFREGEKP